MLFGVGVSCRCILYSIVSSLYVAVADQLHRLGKRANFSAIVYVIMRFLFVGVSSFSLCVILLWHCLGLLYNYFELSCS